MFDLNFARCGDILCNNLGPCFAQALGVSLCATGGSIVRCLAFAILDGDPPRQTHVLLSRLFALTTQGKLLKKRRVGPNWCRLLVVASVPLPKNVTCKNFNSIIIHPFGSLWIFFVVSFSENKHPDVRQLKAPAVVIGNLLELELLAQRSEGPSPPQPWYSPWKSFPWSVSVTKDYGFFFGDKTDAPFIRMPFDDKRDPEALNKLSARWKNPGEGRGLEWNSNLSDKR